MLCSFLDGLVSTPLTSLNLAKNGIVVSHGGGWTHDPGAYVHTDGRETDDRPEGVDFEADLSGIKALADALVSTPLTDLNLGYNGIGKEGAVAIAGALPR